MNAYPDKYDFNNSANETSSPAPPASPKKTLWIILVVLSLILGAGSGFFVAKQFFPTIVEKEVQSASEQTNEPETPIVSQLSSIHSTLVYETEIENPSNEQMETILNMIRVRLDGYGYTEAIVSAQRPNQIKVELPVLDFPIGIEDFLEATAQLQFINANGDVVLTGADVETASAHYDQLNEMNGEEHYVEIKFTPEGVEKFATATAVAASAPDGQNYIAIAMDDNVLSTPRVQEAINSETCVITGNFTPETAGALAAQIRSGQLPFSLNLVERYTTN